MVSERFAQNALTAGVLLVVVISVIATGDKQPVHPPNMTIRREATIFLQTLYPNVEFHLVCEPPRGLTSYGRCSAAAVGGTLPPIAILCPSTDIPQTTCHVASGDDP